MGNIFDTFISKPLGFVLDFIYDFVGSYGLALILFTILIKLVLLPLSLKQQRSTAKMAALAPRQREIEKKFKQDRQRQSQEIAKLYQEEGVNPAAGCLPLLLQLPIIIALFNIVGRPLTYLVGLEVAEILNIGATLGIEVSEATLRSSELVIAQGLWENIELFPQYANINPINFNFLGINLASTPSINAFSALWLVPILAAIASYVSIVITQKINPASKVNPKGQAAGVSRSMAITMPLMSLWLCFTMPAGVGVYWILSSLFTIAQQYILNMLVPVSTALDSGKGKKKPAQKALPSTDDTTESVDEDEETEEAKPSRPAPRRGQGMSIADMINMSMDDDDDATKESDGNA